MTSLQIELQNNTGASALYAHVTGQDSQGVFLLQSDGKTAYHPASPGNTLAPLAADCAILVGGSGATKTLTVPQISGARIWFSQQKPLTFLLNPGPAIVEPSATNTSDPNYEQDWGFCEFTYNSSQLYVNISYVDFVSLPVSLQLQNQSGTVTKVEGLPSDGLDTIATQLTALGGPWEKLVVKSSSGSTLRVLSPNSGGTLFSGLFNDYYQSYVQQVWDKYSSENLTVNTQYTWGNVTGRVSGGKLTFQGVGSFAQPAAADIFSCSSGPFAAGSGVSQEMLNIGARLAAALNRSTLLTDAQQPEGEVVSNYYQNSVTNHYAKICHQTSVGGRGYAFPYDDVGPSSGQDQSGFLSDPQPKLLTVSVGKPL
jgi:hypothetical protein